MSVSAPRNPGKGAQRDVSRGVVVAVIVVLVLILGSGVFYLMNGGFKTASMQNDEWVHVGYPLKMARKGDLSALEAENKLRQSKGQPLLEKPPLLDVHDSPDDLKASANELRAAMQKNPGSTGASTPK